MFFLRELDLAALLVVGIQRAEGNVGFGVVEVEWDLAAGADAGVLLVGIVLHVGVGGVGGVVVVVVVLVIVVVVVGAGPGLPLA